MASKKKKRARFPWMSVGLAVGVLLLPVATAAAWALGELILNLGSPGGANVSNETWALVAGFWLWLFVYYTLPRPLRTYVIAHELTHALWAWVLGADVHGIHIRRDSGAVILSHSNFFITLAPYFFPLYTVLVIAVYYAADLFLDVARFELWWLGLIGFSWGFHFTFTLSTLTQRQPDIRECGRLFSLAFILLMNVLGVALWVIMVTNATLAEFWGLFVDRASRVGRAAGFVWEAFRSSIPQ